MKYRIEIKVDSSQARAQLGLVIKVLEGLDLPVETEEILEEGDEYTYVAANGHLMVATISGFHEDGPLKGRPKFHSWEAEHSPECGGEEGCHEPLPDW